MFGEQQEHDSRVDRPEHPQQAIRQTADNTVQRRLPLNLPNQLDRLSTTVLIIKARLLEHGANLPRARRFTIVVRPLATQAHIRGTQRLEEATQQG